MYDEDRRGTAILRIATGLIVLAWLYLSWDKMPDLAFLALAVVLIAVSVYPLFRGGE